MIILYCMHYINVTVCFVTVTFLLLCCHFANTHNTYFLFLSSFKYDVNSVVLKYDFKIFGTFCSILCLFKPSDWLFLLHTVQLVAAVFMQ